MRRRRWIDGLTDGQLIAVIWFGIPRKPPNAVPMKKRRPGEPRDARPPWLLLGVLSRAARHRAKEGKRLARAVAVVFPLHSRLAAAGRMPQTPLHPASRQKGETPARGDLKISFSSPRESNAPNGALQLSQADVFGIALGSTMRHVRSAYHSSPRVSPLNSMT